MGARAGMSAQEAFWRGSFGDEYRERNRVEWERRRSFWDLILEKTAARTVLEVGCNAGWNLLALRACDPTVKLRGVDVNAAALAEARARSLDAREASGREIGALWPRRFDLTFTAGVLIHVAPDDLLPTMHSIIATSRRWVLAVEYWAEKEEQVEYRGHEQRLWRRPFGAAYQALGLHLVDSGNLLPGDGFDNCAWWLLEKS